jgi:uncharacterized protein YkwD
MGGGTVTQEMRTAYGQITNHRGLAPFNWSNGLALAASALCDDLGPRGTHSNIMSDGQTLDDRLAHFGTVSERRGESIIY